MRCHFNDEIVLYNAPNKYLKKRAIKIKPHIHDIPTKRKNTKNFLNYILDVIECRTKEYWYQFIISTNWVKYINGKRFASDINLN